MKAHLFVLAFCVFFATMAFAEPTRVATLLPFVDQALSLDPEHVEVVATVRSDLHVPVAEGTIDLGSPHSPSFERLAEARPQYLVGDQMIHSMIDRTIASLWASTMRSNGVTSEPIGNAASVQMVKRSTISFERCSPCVNPFCLDKTVDRTRL